MEGREKEVGRSKGHSVMGWIEHETWLDVKADGNRCGELRADVQQVSHCERAKMSYEGFVRLVKPGPS
jgi:hypothetical protein